MPQVVHVHFHPYTRVTLPCRVCTQQQKNNGVPKTWRVVPWSLICLPPLFTLFHPFTSQFEWVGRVGILPSMNGTRCYRKPAETSTSIRRTCFRHAIRYTKKSWRCGERSATGSTVGIRCVTFEIAHKYVAGAAERATHVAATLARRQRAGSGEGRRTRRQRLSAPTTFLSTQWSADHHTGKSECTRCVPVRIPAFVDKCECRCVLVHGRHNIGKRCPRRHVTRFGRRVHFTGAHSLAVHTDGLYAHTILIVSSTLDSCVRLCYAYITLVPI